MPTLHLILARAANGVIGKANTLPWRLPEDMAHFKRTTMGCPVVMGRKTWDSLPPKFRPLPGRINIVLTRHADWQADGALRAASLEEALGLCPADAKVWITGGADVYAQAMALASTAVVTEIEAEFEGDAYAPKFGGNWKETERERHVSAAGLAFSFVTYHNTALTP
ncbi:dihydrofolate reductase [Pseudorhodoferax sp. Leaf267]|uniref:dihydrofolate reductase n=1 Tax=Pseudorhodoferax sp. Leaf267 TaxID=1736316 RepID=UPI0006F84D67|nr:dihydrofolate reductase [Pseudorhodoferax sp. Leaf267]KQP17884.1 dihydrofolate reductase [Pseudorhodoferax sp. Leaf267]